jgi:hypothetical protein
MTGHQVGFSATLSPSRAHAAVCARRFGIPPTMIAAASRRRMNGDWRGACAAADVEVRLDLEAVSARHGAEITAALLGDLRVLAPDLLRWHLPRASHGSGRLLGGLVVPLARYPDRGGGARGGGALTLVAATPDYALAAGERIVLTTLEPRRAAVDATGSLQRHSLIDQRMFWDSSCAGALVDLCATRRGARQITGLQDAGRAVEAWTAAGFTLVLSSSAGLNRRLAGVPVNLPGLAGRVREALPGVATAAIRFGGGAIVLQGLDRAGGSPPISAELVPPQVARPLPTVPDAVWMRPVDVDLLRFGLLRPDDLHPLVAAALVPESATAEQAAAQPTAAQAAIRLTDDRLYRAVPGVTSFAAAPDGAVEVRVRCGPDLHRIVQRDHRWQMVDHQSVEARESLVTLLGGRMNPCCAAAHYLNAGRHVIEFAGRLLEHGRITEVVDVLCEHADSEATTFDYEFEDGRTLREALDALNDRTHRLRRILSGDLPPGRTDGPAWCCARMYEKKHRHGSRKGDSARAHR